MTRWIYYNTPLTYHAVTEAVVLDHPFFFAFYQLITILYVGLYVRPDIH
jgi:hypothetical protein